MIRKLLRATVSDDVKMSQKTNYIKNNSNKLIKDTHTNVNVTISTQFSFRFKYFLTELNK